MSLIRVRSTNPGGVLHSWGALVVGQALFCGLKPPKHFASCSPQMHRFRYDRPLVHFSGLYLLARASATGEAMVILQAFPHNSFASAPARE